MAFTARVYHDRAASSPHRSSSNDGYCLFRYSIVVPMDHQVICAPPFLHPLFFSSPPRLFSLFMGDTDESRRSPPHCSGELTRRVVSRSRRQMSRTCQKKMRTKRTVEPNYHMMITAVIDACLSYILATQAFGTPQRVLFVLFFSCTSPPTRHQSTYGRRRLPSFPVLFKLRLFTATTYNLATSNNLSRLLWTTISWEESDAARDAR